MPDLGRLLWTERVHRRWTLLVAPVVVGLPVVLGVAQTWLAVLGTALTLLVIFALAQRIRLEVRERGVVVIGFVARRRYTWSQITAFAPMPLSTGGPGVSGSVVSHGVNHEIHALGEPGLYEKLRELNRLLDLSRATEGRAISPPRPDPRRSDFTRRRLTLWLGPGAGWWPQRPAAPEAQVRPRDLE